MLVTAERQELGSRATELVIFLVGCEWIAHACQTEIAVVKLIQDSRYD